MGSARWAGLTAWWAAWSLSVGCPAFEPAPDPCVRDARARREAGDLTGALRLVEGCPTPTAAVAVERASLLYRLGRPAKHAWAVAFRTALRENADHDLTARAACSYGQLALDEGDVQSANEVLAAVEARSLSVSDRYRHNLAYVRALVDNARGRVDESHRRLGRLARDAGAPFARYARVARANLWGRTGRSTRALDALRALLTAGGHDDPELLHAAAWNGLLVVEEQVGRRGRAAPALVDEVRALYRRLAQVDASSRERAAATRIERAWLAHLLGEHDEVELPAAAVFPRDRGYLALLRSERLSAEGRVELAAQVLVRWLETDGDTDDEIALRAYMRLAALGQREHAGTAWGILGRRFIATHTLTGRSDVLGRFRPIFAADVQRRVREGAVAAGFGLAATYTGASFRRLHLQSCIEDQAAELKPLVERYWALQAETIRADAVRDGLSQAGLRQYREAARGRGEAQDELLQTIERRCAGRLGATWLASLRQPAVVHDRIRAALGPRDALILPFGAGWFVMTGRRTAYETRLDADTMAEAERIFVVYEADRELPAGLHALRGRPGRVAYLPDAAFLVERRAAAPLCRDAGRPVIVADPELNLPFSRRSGRALAARHPRAVHLEGGQATVAAVRAASDAAAWLFYGGHAIVDAKRDRAELVLADGRLDPSDTLLQGRPPCMAILLSCETGARQSGERPYLGLVDAYLASGATVVVATSSRIDDRAAGALTRLLRFERPAEIGASLDSALQRLDEAHAGLRAELQVWGVLPP